MRTTRSRRRVATRFAPILSLLLAGAAASAPSGEQVVLGDVSIEQNADGSVTVIHASDGSVIEYQSFDILEGELVQFIQPGADARVLNRVFGTATQIDGTLLANGIVYILNPAGVFLNGQAVIEVGGLVAAAGNLSNEDFVSGVDNFELTGPVVNASDDVRGDLVALLGTRVENHGRIEARDGVIALVAGEKVVLVQLDGRVHVQVDGPAGPAQDDAGVTQAGYALTGGGQAILAVGDHYSLAINHNGVTTGSDVELRGGEDGTLLVQGEIDASDAQGRGGSIRVTGDRIAVQGATLDASGGSGGGEIRIGGDVRGEGSLPTAKRTYVDAESVLRADATEAGDGGSVVVWGDEAAVMAGAISARGGASGGDGGFAEVSSLGLLDPSGTVDLGADAGRSGTFLLDPQDIVIIGGTADGSDDPNVSDSELAADDGTLGQILFGDLGDGSDPFQIYESEIEGTNANLVLEARNSVTVSGSFDHDAQGEGSGVVVLMDDNDLTIRTRNDTDDELGSATTPGIDLGSVAWRTGGTGSIEIATGDDGAGGGGTGLSADIAVGDLSTEGGSIDLHTENGSITTGNLTSSGLDGDTGGGAGSIRLIATLTGGVTTGDLVARGGAGATGAGGDGGTVTVATGDGAIGLANVDTRGGQGATRGGNAGGVDVTAEDAGSIDVAGVMARGGDADSDLSGDPEAGGGGGSVTLRADDGDISVGAIESSGGDGSASGARGAAGDVVLTAGNDGSGSVLLSDAIVAMDGAGAGDPVANGGVQLQAEGDVEFSPGIVGADIVTTENVNLIGRNVGAANPIEIDAVGLTPDLVNETRSLFVDAEQMARVNVSTAGFDSFLVSASSAEADIDVTQQAVNGSGTAIDINLDGAPGTSTLVRAEMRDPDLPGGAELQVQLADDLTGMDDVALELSVASGAIDGANAVGLFAEDDIVLGDGAVTMHPTDDLPSGGLLVVRSDVDADGTGAIRAGGAGVAIDMNAEATNPTGPAYLLAAEGVGAPGSPIRTANVDQISVGNTTSGGIHLVNTAGGDVTLDPGLSQFGMPYAAADAVAVTGGDGDVEIENQSGDLWLAGDVRAVGDMGSGGNVTLAVTDPDATIQFRSLGSAARVEAAGDVLLDGPVLLTLDGEVAAGGDVGFADSVDSNATTLTTRNLTVTSGGSVRFGGDVGSGFQLRNLGVAGDVELTQDTRFDVLQVASFDGDIDAASDDAAGATIAAGDRVELGGSLGTAGRLSGLVVDGEVVAFDGSGDQSVVVGAGGVALNTNIATPNTPPLATIGKQGGGLRLESVGGGVVIGANQKLTVDGLAELVGDSVQVGDVNAQDLVVDSPDFMIRTRSPGLVQLPGGGLIPDEGTDLIANTISTTSAPTTTGGGPPPRFGTLSGAVDGAGAGGLPVASLSRAITSAALVDASDPALPVFFDLAIGVPDPGNEDEREPLPVSPLLPARLGDEAPAPSAGPPGEDAVLAFLRCSQQAEGARPTRACAPAPGSPLDSPRGVEIAERYRRLFGDSEEAQAARRIMTGSSASASQVRRDVATLLAQLRLLGMDEQAYQGVRDRLLDRVGGAGGREALLAAIRAESRGFPL